MADDGAAQREERLVDVGAAFVAHAQTPELVQPRDGAFHHPAQAAQAGVVVGAAAGWWIGHSEAGQVMVLHLLIDEPGAIREYTTDDMGMAASTFEGIATMESGDDGSIGVIIRDQADTIVRSMILRSARWNASHIARAETRGREGVAYLHRPGLIQEILATIPAGDPGTANTLP